VTSCICICICLSISLLWSPYGIGQTIIFSSCGFFLSSSSFFFFSSPNLSGHRLDVYHFPHMVWPVALVRIWNAGLKCTARGSLEMQDPKNRRKSPSGHHCTILSGYIVATKARIDSRKKTCLSSNISSTCPHNMVNFSLLAAEIVSLVCGTS